MSAYDTEKHLILARLAEGDCLNTALTYDVWKAVDRLYQDKVIVRDGRHGFVLAEGAQELIHKWDAAHPEVLFFQHDRRGSR